MFPCSEVRLTRNFAKTFLRDSYYCYLYIYCLCVLVLVCTFVNLFVVLSLTGEIFYIYLVGVAEVSLNQLKYNQVAFLYGCVNSWFLCFFFPVICLVLYLYINLHVTFIIILFLLLFYYCFIFLL